MQATAKKRGRPRKYDCKEEKARQDIIARRARRRLQRSVAHRDVPFQVYVAPKTSPGSSAANRSVNRLGARADDAHVASRLSTAAARKSTSADLDGCEGSRDNYRDQLTNNATSAESMTLFEEEVRYRGHLCSPTPQSNFGTDWPANPKPMTATSALLLDRAAEEDAGISSPDHNTSLLWPGSHTTDVAASSTKQGVSESTRANVEERDTEDVHIASEDGPSGSNGSTPKRKVGDILVSDGDGEEATYEEGFPSAPNFETESESESDAFDAQPQVDMDEDTGSASESSQGMATRFLESTWGYKCDCDKQSPVEPPGQSAFSLEQMSEYWRTLGLPDAIGHPPSPSGSAEVDQGHLDWASILSGGTSCPVLNIERSQISIPVIQRTWDVDSIICYASCLSINRGLYISYHPPVTRNIKSSVHIFHRTKALHRIPHVRLGSGRQSPQHGVYIFFPGISHPHRTTTYLTSQERQMWIDRLLLPAIRRFCPPNVIQHHPRSFDDVESKAFSRRRETCSGLVQNNMDMHHYVPEQYLESIWRHMVENTQKSDLHRFRGMFIVLSAKNIKLEARSSSLMTCRSRIVSHLSMVLNWPKADLERTWIDVGVEDTAAFGSHTFLFKSQCLRSWINSMKHSGSHPLIASEVFNFNLTGQAGSARVETARSHPLRKGGIIYAQRYNVNKDLFSTASKSGYGLFDELHLEGITCPPSLLDAWIVASRQNRNSGTATSMKSTPQLSRIRKVFEAMKNRIRHALESSVQTSFGVREEYRISWGLFMAVNPSGAYPDQPDGLHPPFWVLRTAQINEFMRWEFNRWISAIESIRARGARQETSWKDHQRDMIMATILIRSLKASVNCHHVAKRSQIFRDTYTNREGKSLQGLDFKTSMHHKGLAWLPHALFNWQGVYLHDALVASTTFTFNGLRGVFRNWKDVEAVSREYCKARELEERLRTSTPEDYPTILESMRNMVYRHFAPQVKRQLCVTSDMLPSSDPELGMECLGLSYDVVHGLTGDPPYLSQVRKGRRDLGNTYPERVHGLFGWDDGIVRTSWDHCYYRQLARRFHTIISNRMSSAEAECWKVSLGNQALQYFWIIPNYNKHSLFLKVHKNSNRPTEMRPFISGILRWNICEEDADLLDEERWLFGGTTYMSGFPAKLIPDNEVNNMMAINTPSYSMNFGCPIPFTNIPILIQEGFEDMQHPNACRDPKVLAHYDAAYNCLNQCLGDPLCDLLLMIVLTFASSSVTPALPMYKRDFEAGRRKDPGHLAVALTTRMLWFLYPCRFPWDRDDGMVLRIPEMVKKMGGFTAFERRSITH